MIVYDRARRSLRRVDVARDTASSEDFARITAALDLLDLLCRAELPTHNPPEPTVVQIEAAARAICDEWGYVWDGDPEDDDQVAPENNDHTERPSKQLYRAAAAAVLRVAGPGTAERARFEALGWNLGSIEEACAELERLSGLARSNFVAGAAAENRRVASLASSPALPSSSQGGSENSALREAMLDILAAEATSIDGHRWNPHAALATRSESTTRAQGEGGED